MRILLGNRLLEVSDEEDYSSTFDGYCEKCAGGRGKTPHAYCFEVFLERQVTICLQCGHCAYLASF